MFAVAGLDHGVERLVVGHHPVHDRDGRQVTFEIAFDGVGAEVRGEADDFRAGRCDGLRRAGDGLGDGFGGVDVDHENAHGESLLQLVLRPGIAGPRQDQWLTLSTAMASPLTSV
ncbi:hypothetical protein D3C79_971180 [compost metagenome]